MDNSEKIISKIKEGNIKPLPRWRFTVKNISAWMVYVLAVAFGALSFSVIMFTIQQVDFDLAEHMSHSWFEALLLLMPIGWLMMLVLFLIAAIIGIRYSKKGYKFTSLFVFGVSVSMSILLGTLFFITGGGKWLENAFDTNISIYESVQDKKIKLWSLPEEGFLSGEILKVEGDFMELEDWQEKSWTIEIRQIDIVPAVRLEIGEKVKIIGKMKSPDTFTAYKVRPWGSAERMRKSMQKK